MSGTFLFPAIVIHGLRILAQAPGKAAALARRRDSNVKDSSIGDTGRLVDAAREGVYPFSLFAPATLPDARGIGLQEISTRKSAAGKHFSRES